MRELANAVEYAVNVEQTPYVTFDSLPVRIREGAKVAGAAAGVLRSAETEAIRKALAECGESLGGKKKAAAMLGIRKRKGMRGEGASPSGGASPLIAFYGSMLSCPKLVESGTAGFRVLDRKAARSYHMWRLVVAFRRASNWPGQLGHHWNKRVIHRSHRKRSIKCQKTGTRQVWMRSST